jgi:glycine/D-amino acid oxidase-like deaminating enzyme
VVLLHAQRPSLGEATVEALKPSSETDQTMRECDVVVVGGGIVGCASAYYLARRGVRVALAERGEIGGEQSGRNWGFVRQQGRDPVEVPLMIESNRLWRGLEEELDADVEWVQAGNLALAGTEERVALFEQWLDTARQFGVDTRLLRPSEVSDLLPGMTRRWAGGLYTPSDGHAEPVKATQAFAAAATRHGARLYPGCAALAVETEGGAVRGVLTERGFIQARTVVCAAGAWSARLVRALELSLPQRWVRATVTRTSVAPPITQVGVWGPALAFRQRRDGTLNLAAGGASDHDVTLESFRHLRLFLPNYWRNRKLFRFHVGRPLLRDLAGLMPGSAVRDRPCTWDRGIEPPPNRDKVRRSLEEFRRLYPGVSGLAITRSWAGYIDATPDAVPVLGEAGPRGLVLATGFSGHGFALGPIAGRLMAELVTDGKTSLDIASFRFSRFAEHAIGQPRSVL